MDHSKAAEQAIRDASARRQALGLVTLIYAAAGFVVGFIACASAVALAWAVML